MRCLPANDDLVDGLWWCLKRGDRGGGVRSMLLAYLLECVAAVADQLGITLQRPQPATRQQRSPPTPRPTKAHAPTELTMKISLMKNPIKPAAMKPRAVMLDTFLNSAGRRARGGGSVSERVVGPLLHR